MMVFFSMLTVLMAAVFLLSNSPFYMSLWLIATIFFFSMNCFTLNLKWGGLVIMMMFLSGMMVIFVYAASLGMSLKSKTLSSYTLGSALILFFTFCLSEVESFSQNVGILFNSSVSVLIFLGAYLIFILLVCVKACKKHSGPLKA